MKRPHGLTVSLVLLGNQQRILLIKGEAGKKPRKCGHTPLVGWEAMIEVCQKEEGVRDEKDDLG